MAEVVVGPGSVDDVRAIARRRATDESTLRLMLELADSGTVWIARDQVAAVGIAVAHDFEEERYVGDLFVEPSFRGAGIGTQLLRWALGSDERTRTILVDPAEPASLALAARYKTPLREPLMQLAGAIPKEEDLARMAAGSYRFEVEPVDPERHGFGLRALDRQTRGTTRDADHAVFARNAIGSAFFLNGEFVAYAYVWPDGRIGPLACASQNYLVQILAFAMLTLTRQGASWCTTLIPGSNLRIARVALESGLTIRETAILATDSPQYDLSAYMACHRLLL